MVVSAGGQVLSVKRAQDGSTACLTHDGAQVWWNQVRVGGGYWRPGPVLEDVGPLQTQGHHGRRVTEGITHKFIKDVNFSGSCVAEPDCPEISAGLYFPALCQMV